MRVRARLIAAGCMAWTVLSGVHSAAWAQAEPVNHITNGPVLGRLSSDGIGIWARTVRAGQFAVRYGTAADKLDTLSEPVKTRYEHDNTGWIHINGLKSNTRYYYELVIPEGKGSTGRSGSFRTLPDAEMYVDRELNPRGLFNFSFEFACGNNQNPDHSSGPANGKFKYGPREVDIHWSTFYRTDIPRDQLMHPHYCVVQINNVFNNPKRVGGERWVAFPRPQVIFKYFDGRTGRFEYAEAVLGREKE